MQDWREVWAGFQSSQNAWVQASAKALAAGCPQVAYGNKRSSPSSSAPLTFELLSDDVVENKILASCMALAMGEALQPGFEPMRLRIQALEGAELPSGYVSFRNDLPAPD
ncbi:hypothetical protein J4711_14540 [Staphylococcus epidermidis]|nr:hypothetical protein [Staphylococcus epidermidis]